MLTLIYDLQQGSWLSINPEVLYEPLKAARYDTTRKGFYPYSYNFVFKKRGEEAQCSLCGVFIQMRDMTREHLYPKSLGGEITTTACYDCNTKKKDMKPIEWAVWSSENGFALRHMQYW